MKDYIIWLSSGESIEGTAHEEILNSLKERFKNPIGDPEIISFNDEDGELVLDISRVVAIAINNCCENRELGFKS